VAMALAHDAHKELVLNAELFLPNAMNIAQLTITATGEAEVESEYGAAVARKLIVQFTGASPFAIYFDQTRGLPVYMAFPQTGIEAFLDEFYMDKPVSRLRRRSTE